MKVCTKCKSEKDLSEYNKNSNKPDGLQNICRTCSNKKSAEHYKSNKQSYRDSKKKSINLLKNFVFDYLKEHACVDCSEADPVVLEFDHVDSKSKNISDMIHAGVSIESLQIELNKCVVRCANCHRKKTAKDFGWYKLVIT
ncbi:MAG: hypothetical protein AB7F43_15130 [Bacteriovoracia bacterium]